MEQNSPAVGAPVEPTVGPEDAAFSAWYAANELYLVTQPFTNYVAAAAWKAAQAAERDRAARWVEWYDGAETRRSEALGRGDHWGADSLLI